MLTIQINWLRKHYMHLCTLGTALGVYILAYFLCLYLALNLLTSISSYLWYIAVLPFIHATTSIIIMRYSPLAALDDILFCTGPFTVVVLIDYFTDFV